MEQAISDKGLQIVHRDDGERPRVARRNDGYPVGHRQAKGVATERTLFRIYKGPGKTRSTLRPNPLRNSNSKAKRPFLERLAQWLPREPLVPSH
jgi:hypothetical protein